MFVSILQNNETFPLGYIFLRSGASGGSNKLDSSSPAGSSARATLKNEQEKSMLSRDGSVGPIKERTLGKLNVRYMSSISIESKSH